MAVVKTTTESHMTKSSVFDFDTVAHRYDKWYNTPLGDMYDRLEKKAVAKHIKQDSKGKKLLEIGCGSGHWSKFFAGRGFEVTGVDVSNRMLQIAKNKNIPNATFHSSDAHSLPFEDNSFDVTVAITTLEFVANAELVLQEMHRCTRKPLGQIIIAVLNKTSELNRNRQEKSDSLYAKARLFSTKELKGILLPYGQPSVITAGFVPKHKALLPLSPLLDMVGQFLHLQNGVFITGQVKL